MSTKQQLSKPDAEHFRDLYHTYRGRLLSSIVGVVRDKEKAEDIVATAFRNAWENREAFRGESSLYTWVHAIAFNAARGSLRRECVLDSIDRNEGREFAEAGLVTDALEQHERIERIRRALRQIPAMHRRVLINHFTRGFSVKRIARSEGIACGTVLSRISTGKRLLRRAWEASG